MGFNSQSRVSTRGPLIAVITIQLDEQFSDKIFLHLNDDDLQMAEQFVSKHGINPKMTAHICQRIRLSRKAVQNQTNGFESSRFESDPPYSDSVIEKEDQMSSHKKNNFSHRHNKQHSAKKNDFEPNLFIENPSSLSYQNIPKQAHKNYISYTDSDDLSSEEKRESYNHQPSARNARLASNTFLKAEHSRLSSYYNSDRLKLEKPLKKQAINEQYHEHYNSPVSSNKELEASLEKRRSQQKDIEKIRSKYNYGSGEKNNSNSFVSNKSHKYQDIYSQDSYKISNIRDESQQRSRVSGSRDIINMENYPKTKLVYPIQNQQNVAYSSSEQESSQGLFEKKNNESNKMKCTLDEYREQKRRVRNRQEDDSSAFENDLSNTYNKKRQINAQRDPYYYDATRQKNEFIECQIQKLSECHLSKKSSLLKEIEDHLPLGLIGRETANFKDFGSRDSYQIDIKSMKSKAPSQAISNSVSVNYMSFKKPPLESDKQTPNGDKISPSSEIKYSPGKSSRRQAGLIRSNSKPHESFKNPQTYTDILLQKKKRVSDKSPSPIKSSSRKFVDPHSNSHYNASSNRSYVNELSPTRDIFDSERSNDNKMEQYEELFQEIKDLHSVKQNRQTNNASEDRPSKVKFFNKSEMQSLKQSYNKSPSMSKAELSRINKEVTERLYNQQDIKKKYLNALKSRARKEKQEEELQNEELTCRPQINHISKAIAEGRVKGNQRIEEHLFEKGKEATLRRQEKINSDARRKLEQCSFRPHIGEISHRLAASRSGSRLKAEQSLSRCRSYTQVPKNTFKPSINQLSEALVKDKGTFEERQAKYEEEKQSKLFKRKQEQKLKQRADLITGQRLYKPQIEEKSSRLKDTSRQQAPDVYTYLYDLSKKQKTAPSLHAKPVISQNSEKMVEQMYEKRLIWLFSELDSDQDGVISSLKICIDEIPTEILEIIAPVLYEMEELKTELNLEDFKNAIKVLNKNLGPTQKSILYNYKYTVKAS